MSRSTRPLAAAIVGVLTLALASCGTTGDGSPSPTALAGASHDDDDHDHDHDHGDHDHGDGEAAGATEASSRMPRLALTYDGGILVVDALTLETIADLPLDGFTRLATTGDGRHVAVSTTGGWAVLDAGTWSVPHGDHSHYYTATPVLTDVLLEATQPGHAVSHDGLNAFFDDATGDITVVETSEWADMVEHGHLHPIRQHTTEHAHHGVAVATADGGLFVTRGDENARTGAMLLDADDAQIAANDECPGIHGETASNGAEGGEFILAGCEDGALVLRDGAFTKLAAPDAFGRIGNAFSIEGDDVVLGDYKTDAQAGLASRRSVSSTSPRTRSPRSTRSVAPAPSTPGADSLAARRERSSCSAPTACCASWTTPGNRSARSPSSTPGRCRRSGRRLTPH